MANVPFHCIYIWCQYHIICYQSLLLQRHVHVESRLQKHILHAFKGKWYVYTCIERNIIEIRFISIIEKIFEEMRFNLIVLIFSIIGRCLNFSSMMVIILVLRYTISRARDLGLSKILPLDHNIYLHKVTGCIIFVCAWTHAIMHVCNFCKFNS